jgi:hypothetical protein
MKSKSKKPMTVRTVMAALRRLPAIPLTPPKAKKERAK